MGAYDTRSGTPRHDPMFDSEGWCEVCHRDGASCVCPECWVCGVAGDPRCYIGIRGDKHKDGDHGMLLNDAQLFGREYRGREAG